MQKTFFVSFFIFLTSLLLGQSIERKIIIQNGNYFFTTIDDNNQLATLHTGKDTTAIKNAKKLAMPVGRNYDDPIVPFAWDVVDTSVYAVSFLLHPLNDRNEAIKRLLISSLKTWNQSPTPMELINLSIDMNPYAYNDPYLFVTRRSNLIEGFFYDLVAPDNNSMTMAISNNGELSIWNYTDAAWKHNDYFAPKWEHGDVLKFPVDGYFSLFELNKKSYLITNSGILFDVSTSGIKQLKKDLNISLKDGFLIVNKDLQTVSFMKNSDLNQQTPLNELIIKKAKRIL